jgi:glucose/arabinose dehydrogenase
MKMLMKKAGAGVPQREPHHAASRCRRRRRRGISLGAAREVSIRRSAWRSSATYLYVADTDALCAFPTADGADSDRRSRDVAQTLPGGTAQPPLDQERHREPDGTKLYVTVGSNSNVAETASTRRKAARRSGNRPASGGTSRIYASGLRNPNGMAWDPDTGALWTAVNERDELGSDLVPDYMTSVRDGGFYGWPYSYYGQHVDTACAAASGSRRERHRSRLRARAAHRVARVSPPRAARACPIASGKACSSASTGRGTASPHSGYKVIFVPFERGAPAGEPVDVLTGFVTERRRGDGPAGRCRARARRRAAGGR